MIVPHPHHVAINLDRRHAEFRAESARDELAKLADTVPGTALWKRWLDFAGAVVALAVLTLLLAAGTAAFIASSLVVPLATLVVH